MQERIGEKAGHARTAYCELQNYFVEIKKKPFNPQTEA